MQRNVPRFLVVLAFFFLLVSLVGCNTLDGNQNLVLQLLEPEQAQLGTGLQPEFSWQVQINPGGARVNPYFLLNVAPVSEEYRDGVQTQQTHATWNQKLLANHTYRWKVEAWLQGRKVASSEERTFTTQDFYTVELGVEGSQGGQVRTDEGTWGQCIEFPASVETPTRLWAQAEENYTFDGWYQGDEMLSHDNPFNYLPTDPMASLRQPESDIQLQARFQKTQCEITVLANPTNAGEVQVNGGEWGEEFNVTVDAGQQVSVQAQAGQGFQFDGWYEQEEAGSRSQKASEENPYVFVAHADRVLSAHFVPQSYSITVQASPSCRGNARVNDGPWGAVQQVELELGSQVEVRALANSFSKFDGWYEDGPAGNRGQKVSEQNPYTFVVQADRVLTASFVPDMYTISVEASPVSRGDVRINGGEWENSEQLELQKGSKVEVEALANPGSRFDGWYEDEELLTGDASCSWSVKQDRHLVARFSPIPGTVKWQFSAGNTIWTCAVIATDGTLYFGSFDDFFYALNPDGTEKWHFQGNDDIRGSPAIGADGTLFFGSVLSDFYALNPDGTEKWNFDWIMDSVGLPVVAIGEDGTPFLGGFDGKMYALDPTNEGTVTWEYDTGHVILSSPAIASDGTLYWGSNNHTFHGLNSADGSEKWTPFSLGGAILSSPAIGGDGTLYVGSDDHKVYALTADGTTVTTGSWPFVTGDQIGASPVLGSDGTIYVGSDDSFFYAINPDGTEKWNFKTGGRVRSTAAIGKDGTIYVGSEDGKLYAFHPDGSVKWISSLDHMVFSSPTIGDDGTIYVGTFSGTFYALYGESGGLADTPWPKFQQNKRNSGRKE